MAKKNKAEEMSEKLLEKKQNVNEKLDAKEKKTVTAFAEEYKIFLDKCKTEREATVFAVDVLKKAGFTEYDCDKKYKPGDKIYLNNRDKSVIAAVVGKKKLDLGMNITAAHIDCPRLDLKQHPVYENGELCYFKTHYYGGIKKYQWTCIPLALHGVIYKADGEKITVSVGEDDGDPKFTISDLLPHLAQKQMQKTLAEAFTGEDLNAIIGSTAFDGEKVNEAVKLGVLALLNEKYGITESDFVSSELCLVPAVKACDIGFDRALIGGYGHDDRSNSFAALKALLSIDKTPDKTAVLILADKEEIGSVGSTGLQAAYFSHFVRTMCNSQNVEPVKCFKSSKCLSADVNADFDPSYPDVVELPNCGKLHYGGVMAKYTGARGKSSTNDASAEVVSYFRRLFDENGVIWQTGELGKADVGGGGTVAQYLANLDIDTVDFGVGMLSMHAPFEIISKADLYMTYRAFEVFYKLGK